MSAIKRDLKGWLARLEIRASTTHWDRHAAHYRKTRRAVVEIYDAIRERLLLMGLDPELAVSWQRRSLLRSQIQKRYGLLMRRSRAAIRMTMGKRWAYP